MITITDRFKTNMTEADKAALVKGLDKMIAIGLAIQARRDASESGTDSTGDTYSKRAGDEDLTTKQSSLVP